MTKDFASSPTVKLETLRSNCQMTDSVKFSKEMKLIDRLLTNLSSRVDPHDYNSFESFLKHNLTDKEE